MHSIASGSNYGGSTFYQQSEYEIIFQAKSPGKYEVSEYHNLEQSNTFNLSEKNGMYGSEVGD